MISKKYNEMLKKLEYNISNKKELDFAKKAMCEISLAYVDEIAEMTDNYSSKIIGLEKRVSNLENNLKDYNEEENKNRNKSFRNYNMPLLWI